MNFDRKSHWEKIYETKPLDQVGWYQPIPGASLDFIAASQIPKDARIIDVGGGDSFLVDHLIELGFSNVTVLDISANAIDRAKKRLGAKARLIKWIEADSSIFKPIEHYDFWHDRAAFHFLTNDLEIENYINIVKTAIKADGYLVIGTFSENGPKKCSGIVIQQYSAETMTDLFKPYFKKIKCIHVDHITPSDVIQNYVFCIFQKITHS